MSEIDELRATIARLESERLRQRLGLDVSGPQICLKEASFLTGFHRETVKQWCEAGKVDGRRCGGQWRVSYDSLLAFVALRRSAQVLCSYVAIV